MEGLLVIAVLIVSGMYAYNLVGRIRETRRIEKECSAAKERKAKFWNYYEPLNRKDQKYPRDWQARRTLVYLSRDGLCEECGSRAGKCRTSEELLWFNKNYYKARYVSGAHIHHKLEISKGGDHSFGNLQLLCDQCHSRKHPHGQGMLKAVKISAALSVINFNNEEPPKIKKSRKDWCCFICGSEIISGSEYYGSTYTKVCMGCYRRYKNKIG